MLIPLILFTVHASSTAWAHPRDRHAAIHRRQDHQIVIVVPDACWWGASGAPTPIGVCSEDGTKMDITQIYTTKTTSPANFIFGGLTQSGTAELPDGTIHMVPEDVMSCTAGWVVNPTTDVTFTMPPSATTHYTSLVTSGGAFLACMTECPTALPSTSSSSSSSSTSTSGGASSTSTSISVDAPSSAPSASITTPPDPCHPARRHLYPREACPSLPIIGGDEDQPEGQVWLTIPDSHVSVHPHQPIVGDWNAAGPFAHLFSFHAWVPTYLNETFDIAILGDDNLYTSKTACSIGLTARPSGSEIVTYTLVSSSPWAQPSGDINGAYLRC